MKVYIIYYYNSGSNAWETHAVFGEKERAEEVCKIVNKSFPELKFRWVEYDVQ